jgi:hypothetical protein
VATRGQRLLAVVVVPAAAIVTALLLYMRMRFEPPTVPGYALAPLAAASDGAALELQRGGQYVFAAEPMGMVQGAVGARAFLVRGDDEVRLWEPPFSVDRDGSVHIEGKVDALFVGVPAGAWEVDVAVGRPETLPTAPRDILRARANAGSPTGEHAAWHLVRQPIVLGG